MNPSELHAQITAPEAIRRHLDWNQQQDSLRLPTRGPDGGHTPTRSLNVDFTSPAINVVSGCMRHYAAR